MSQDHSYRENPLAYDLFAISKAATSDGLRSSQSAKRKGRNSRRSFQGSKKGKGISRYAAIQLYSLRGK